ncbi:DNA-binding CsgD family transcriptional regulator [Sphingomicrobium lutaoense]|uniref:DNA-binding CsgD family transcriptional regulator n=2 Tax=Sphingomicrobium lutaoense TaxID=515949 RepID=A0A839YZK6_9SPHN|nr:helix-turn-helix transcriptional regulator [Sphingomicrobium lutaoense]MBB3764426.1 DNA-binding CsgD family transcriptional regulator [Sphingomicrobium lutaoense]
MTRESDDLTQRVEKLSPGQLECLELVDAHLSSKEIAAELDISPHTVDQRIRQSLQILGVSRRQQAARLVAQVRAPYQRLIHQSSHIPAPTEPRQTDEAISNQIRHADRAGSSGFAGPKTEQGHVSGRISLPLPFATRNQPRNEMGVGTRLLWIAIIAMGATFSAGMYLAGLESLARLLKG